VARARASERGLSPQLISVLKVTQLLALRECGASQAAKIKQLEEALERERSLARPPPAGEQIYQ
jgi:hypothetical protein